MLKGARCSEPIVVFTGTPISTSSVCRGVPSARDLDLAVVTDHWKIRNHFPERPSPMIGRGKLRCRSATGLLAEPRMFATNRRLFQRGQRSSSRASAATADARPPRDRPLPVGMCSAWWLTSVKSTLHRDGRLSILPGLLGVTARATRAHISGIVVVVCAIPKPLRRDGGRRKRSRHISGTSRNPPKMNSIAATYQRAATSAAFLLHPVPAPSNN